MIFIVKNVIDLFLYSEELTSGTHMNNLNKKSCIETLNKKIKYEKVQRRKILFKKIKIEKKE
jgi:hypothetical protein